MSGPLRIGVDARELLGQATGVGRYLGELLRRWAARPDADRRRFVLYAPDQLPIALPAGTTEVHVTGAGRGTWWEQTHLRRAVLRDRPDVFFAPAYTAPLGAPMPLAVTIHDISFVAHPEWFRAGEGMRRRWLTRRAAARASVIFTDSAFSRAEIETHLKADPARVRVIPPGVTPSGRRGGSPAMREPIVLFVGSLFNRRRLPDLIAAFARLAPRAPGSRLVIVGDDRTWPRQDLTAVAAAHGVTDRVELLRYVSDDALSDLYARASVFAFLSEYEGFGLTPLEALSAGVPPVVLDTKVAREVYRDAAVFVGAGDLDGTAESLLDLLQNRERAADIVARGRAVVASYSWETAADATLVELERIAAP